MADPDRNTISGLNELDGTARADLWPKLIEAAPFVGAFRAQTARQIPSFVLSRMAARFQSATLLASTVSDSDGLDLDELVRVAKERNSEDCAWRPTERC